MMEAAGLTAEGRALVASYWWSRAEGEMTSWVGWSHVLDDLRAEHSPASVVELAERAVSDEYQHALWCRDWAVRFGHPGGEPRPRGNRPFTLPGRTDHENRLLRIALVAFTETVGSFTLRHVRPLLKDRELRALNRRHQADELQHGRAGWAHLSTLRGSHRDFVRAAVPVLLGFAETICCDERSEEREDLVTFGYFTPRLLRAAHDDAVASVIRPGLVHLRMMEAA